MAKDLEALKPCPLRWCKSAAVKVMRYDARKPKFWVQCECCELKSPQMPSRIKAVRLWNGDTQ